MYSYISSTLTTLLATTAAPSNGSQLPLGLITFVGLLALIAIVGSINAAKKRRAAQGAPVAPAAQSDGADIPGDRRKVIAAICAAIATDMGTDVSGLRIRSVKKLG